MCVANTLLDTREAISPPRPQSPRAFYPANFMTAPVPMPGIGQIRPVWRALLGLPHICHAETR